MIHPQRHEPNSNISHLLSGAICCIGGPALIYYVTPSEEELFSRYNPELQRRSLENREGKQQDFENFVGKLKEYSKSDRPSEQPPFLFLFPSSCCVVVGLGLFDCPFED